MCSIRIELVNGEVSSGLLLMWINGAVIYWLSIRNVLCNGLNRVDMVGL